MQREGSCCNHWEWHWCGHEVLRCRSQHCKGQPDVWEWNFIGWAHRDYFESAGWWCSLQKNWMDGGHKPHSYIKYSAFVQSCTQLLSNAWVECQKSYKKHFYFQYSDKDSSRLASKVGPENVKAFLTIQATVPGIPFNYYGNEIGMTDHPTHSGRWKYRTPMQWDRNGTGFSQNPPWLTQNPNHKTVNVEVTIWHRVVSQISAMFINYL